MTACRGPNKFGGVARDSCDCSGHVSDPLDLFALSPGTWSESDLRTLRLFDDLVRAGGVLRFRARDWRNLTVGLRFVLTMDPREPMYTLVRDAEGQLREYLLEVATEGLAELDRGRR